MEPSGMPNEVNWWMKFDPADPSFDLHSIFSFSLKFVNASNFQIFLFDKLKFLLTICFLRIANIVINIYNIYLIDNFY